MKRKRHTPEQIIAKLREADWMLAAGSGIPCVAKVTRDGVLSICV